MYDKSSVFECAIQRSIYLRASSICVKYWVLELLVICICNAQALKHKYKRGLVGDNKTMRLNQVLDGVDMQSVVCKARLDL